jgi:hypothetical protein
MFNFFAQRAVMNRTATFFLASLILLTHPTLQASEQQSTLWFFQEKADSLRQALQKGQEPEVTNLEVFQVSLVTAAASKLGYDLGSSFGPIGATLCSLIPAAGIFVLTGACTEHGRFEMAKRILNKKTLAAITATQQSPLSPYLQSQLKAAQSLLRPTHVISRDHVAPLLLKK